MSIIRTFREKYYLLRGQRFLMKGNPEKAYFYFQKAVFLGGSDQVHYSMGLCLVSMNRYQEAEHFLKKAVDKFPENDLVLVTYAECMLMQRKWEQARGIFEKLCELNNSKYAKYLSVAIDPIKRDKYVAAKESFNEAQKAINNRDFESALTLLQKAYELDNHNAYVVNNIGSVMLSLGKPLKEVYGYFEKAVVIDPDNQKFRQNLLYVKKLMNNVKKG